MLKLLPQADEVTITDAARVLGCHRITIWRACKDGRLRARKRGHFWYVSLATVAAWQEHHRQVKRLLAQAPK